MVTCYQLVSIVISHISLFGKNFTTRYYIYKNIFIRNITRLTPYGKYKNVFLNFDQFHILDKIISKIKNVRYFIKLK
jgi:hypothetical protein